MDEQFISYEDVKNVADEEFFKGSKLAINAFRNKYVVAELGEKTPADIFWRVAQYSASAEKTKELREYWARRWFHEMYTGQWMAGGSILQGSNNPKKISLSNCFSGDTEFITPYGAMKFIDIGNGVATKIIDNHGSWKDAVVKKFGTQKLYKLTLARLGFTKEINCTPNHIWRTLEGETIVEKETIDLKENDLIPYTKRKWMPSKNDKKRYVCPIGFIHGLVFGDGYFNKDAASCFLDLCGDSRQFTKLFEGGFNWIINKDVDGERDRIRYLPDYMKNFPAQVSNEEYILGFISGWFAADGTVGENGSCELSSANLDNLLWLKSVAAKVGIYITNIRLVRNKSPFDGNENHKLYSARITKDCIFEGFLIKENHIDNFEKSKATIRGSREKTNWKVISVEDLNVEEDVWCVEADGGNFTLQDGVNTHNCTTLGFAEDTLEAIYDTSYMVAKVAAYRQGLGVHFDLRPKGMKVNNASNISEGNTHWMKYINQIGHFIGQKGRIPAMLYSINDWNPDLLDFIKVKSDQETIANANISIHFSNKFMECLEKDGVWKMRYESEKGDVLEREEKASVIFDMFVDNNWFFAEPGAQYIDIARKYSNSDYLGDDRWKIKSTNACCVTADTFVLTNKGKLSIEEIYDIIVNKKENLEALSIRDDKRTIEFKPITNAFQERNDVTVTLEVEEEGKIHTLECSSDHPILTRNRGYVQASSLTEDDDIMLVSFIG